MVGWRIACRRRRGNGSRLSDEVGLVRERPSIEFQSAVVARLHEVPDPEVLAAQHAGADRASKVVVGLKPGFHLFRVPGVELFARRIKRCPQFSG